MRNPLYQKLQEQINQKNHSDLALTVRPYAGVAFLYANKEHYPTRETFENELQDIAQELIIGTIWNFTYLFIRTSTHAYVYRAQFVAPMEKSFCCGNGCPDCVRLRST
ncbi:hypothetical protein SAMN04487866_10865 [Thermoactinomyces sp. DSM 45891]|uniref:hypothetical protein n=1 Tax=Thermoactinomyces sp. DSM 45891 TaxID=1761907 RepID=UPI000917B1A4|nr:hypothetical protein [Thermoactinomyces sp. DSM 45891]SFX45422.1 hypothetical protein SAMN04487866_10865 [Thermoactinomyces sp. DSM 45891]